MKRLIVDYGLVFNRVALMDRDQLVELFIENTLNKSLVGNIYLGRVVNVVDSISAAFINIGHKRNAYLPIKQKEKISGEVLVQVKKDPIGDKGATLTRDLSISGSCMVLLPYGRGVMVSKKIQASEERLEAVEAALDGMGCVLRTESAHQDLEVILQELAYLKDLWLTIEKSKRRILKDPLVHRDFAFEGLIQKDYLPLVDQVVINDPDKVRSLSHKDIQVHKGPEGIFQAYKVDGQIAASLQRNVNLHQGSFITIDETEALTTIDVNSGHYVGTHNKEETFLQVNLAAAKEIAKQVRLRNLSGIIIIDFINMKAKANYDLLLKSMAKYFRQDRSMVTIHGVTNLGLVEVTRKKHRKSLKNQLMDRCETCQGSGYVTSFNIAFKQLEDKLRALMAHTGEKTFYVGVNGHMKEMLDKRLDEETSYWSCLVNGLGLDLSLEVLESLEGYSFQTGLKKT